MVLGVDLELPSVAVPIHLTSHCFASFGFDLGNVQAALLALMYLHQ